MNIHEYILNNWNKYSRHTQQKLLAESILYYEIPSSHFNISKNFKKFVLPIINLGDIQITRVRPKGYGNYLENNEMVFKKYHWSKPKKYADILHIGLTEQECLDLLIKEYDLLTLEEYKIKNL